MRRVIDDTHLEEVANEIMGIIKCMPADEVSKYSWGMYRAERDKILDYVFGHTDLPIKLGENKNTSGIGNNWKRELIWTGDEKEEQICGILCLIDDMYGNIYAYITSIDGNNVGNRRKIFGCDPKYEYDREHKRFGGWGE